MNPAAGTVRIRFVLQELDGKPQAGGFARLVNTRGPAPPDTPVAASGRGYMTVARAKIRKTIGGRFRRLEVELHRPTRPQPRKLAFLLEP